MKRILSLTIVLTATFALSTASGRPGEAGERRLVSVRVAYQSWNEYRPWEKTAPSIRRFPGIVVSTNRILVLAHNLDDATLIQVEKFDRPPRVPARIVHRDSQVDLALIAVDDPGFFDDLTPVKVADSVGDGPFLCEAWKEGQLTKSSCRWSRVVVRSSATPHFHYAGVYFITDLKNGGSGEPIFSGERLVGMVRSQNRNRVISFPAELIRAYLRAAERKNYPGFADLGIAYQFNRGAGQSSWLGLSGGRRGVLVRSCLPGGTADGGLKPGDLLLELDGRAINSRGDYLHPRYGWLDLNLIASDGHYAGDEILAKVLRDGKERTVRLELKNIPPSVDLLPESRLGNPPSYLFAAGFVFRELDMPYLRSWGEDWFERIPARLRIYAETGHEILPGSKRLIILAGVFPDPYNIGYHDLRQCVVRAVNGRTVSSIAELEEAFNHPSGRFQIIDFVPSFDISHVVLDAGGFDEATRRIMRTYRIPSRIRKPRASEKSKAPRKEEEETPKKEETP